MMSRRLRQLLVIGTFVISAMIYFRTTMEEASNNEESSKTNYWNIVYLSSLALFAGLFEASEVYDHLFPQQFDAADDESSESRAIIPATSVKKIMLIATGMTVLAPPLMMCAWAHKLQGNALARSLGMDNDVVGLILATPQLAKFFVVSIPHLFHTLNGSREKFSLSVTHNENTQLSQPSIPPLKWWLMLSLLIYLHMPEGMLIASPIRDETLKYLASFGFAFAESLPHINQLEQLPHNIAKLLQNKAGNSSFASIFLRFGAGTMGGLGSASEALMAAFVGTRSRATAWIAPLVEFVLGFAETQQHLVPSIEALSKHLTLFRHVGKDQKSRQDTAPLLLQWPIRN